MMNKWFINIGAACVILLYSSLGNAESQENYTHFPNTDLWIKHFQEDILPYWTVKDALGTPVGNFPTFRDMSGKLVDKEIEIENRKIRTTDRYVRTIARQVYVYLIGYTLTGEQSLLTYAQNGLEWINRHYLKYYFT
uniref:Uncharacterized protein n=1 Tax=Candidatus Kentrum sp. LPFa TaxID=2126335 RepID=A0A450XZQ8_9GAMM|nr:MAG: hypothetical protein BECKLPF1236A_GA0070988_103085 [Candidatus Kentron sp. LPFa]VFK34755.1 MAG: hypothetical protein BECKLPF1236C_GA0070990_102965 [Candidatus Kentron sp. LPFa]